jgi:BirA family biotin operon repressor/biotin-[acetyl-CoA-carboxylase] ligase
LKLPPSDPRPEPLPDELVRAIDRLTDRLRPIGRRWLYYPRIHSTNDVAASLARFPDSEGTVVVADEQTAGRGRRGHGWFSPPCSGLYVSIVLAPA